MSKPLPRSAPEAQGVEPSGVTGFLKAVEAAGLELHSFMMLRHGAVVAEGWWKPYGPEMPHMLFSLSKSFTSTAVGFAVGEGLLSVDDPVLEFFPEEAKPKPGRNWADMKVRHLLSMSTGHDRDTTEYMIRRRDGDWAKGFLWQPVRHRPGTHFLYNTGATYMLSVIVQKLTGQRLLDYLTPRLFAPLGIEGATWEQCPKGVDTGGFGLSLKTEDIAKFGQFLLQRGAWEGRQLLSAAWVDEATARQVENAGSSVNPDWVVGYGYQFWRCVPDCYHGDGAFGQFCVVVPRLDMVIAITSGLADMQAVLTQAWTHLLPAAGDRRPDDLPARQAMRDALAGLRYDPPAFGAQPEQEARLSGRTFGMERNPQRIKSFVLEFGPESCTVTCTAAGGERKTEYGRNRWRLSPVPAPPTFGGGFARRTVLAGAFAWEDGSTLALTERDLHAPFVTMRRLRFEGDGVTLSTGRNVSLLPEVIPDVKGTLTR